jgi:CTP:phosphocholine cytidylyltransferase-like protein
MKYISIFILGVVVTVFLTLWYILWCVWYVKYGWSNFLVHRYKTLVEYNNDYEGYYKPSPLVTKALEEENYLNSVKRYLRLNMYSNDGSYNRFSI